MAFHLFSSALHSKSGKSVTQRKSHSGALGERALTNRYWISVMRSRNRPSTSHAISHLSAPKKTQSPSSILSRDCNDCFSVSEKNFTIGDFHSPFSILIKASPFAPYS